MAEDKYQLWWTDDKGERLFQLDQKAFLSFNKIVNGKGTINIGFPFDWRGYFFRKDYRIEVWRAPNIGGKRRLENIYFMQKPRVYTRQDDNVTILQMFGIDALGMLERRIVKYKATTSQSRKTDNIDDMMKEIVDENMGAAAFADDADRAVAFNEGFFQVQGGVGDGASITKSFPYRNVLAVLKELAQQSITNEPRIFFDVVPVTPTLFEFQTFTNQRGGDKRFSAGKTSFMFSLDRGNLETPQFEIDGFDEQNVIYAGGQGTGAARDRVERNTPALEDATVWARAEGWKDARQEALGAIAALNAEADEQLAFMRPKERFVTNFLDVPGSRYGIDWDWGNRHTVDYADQLFDIYVKVVYFSIDENNHERIIGRNEFGEFVA